jgi:membrane-associated phospholipid phosphatase
LIGLDLAAVLMLLAPPPGDAGAQPVGLPPRAAFEIRAGAGIAGADAGGSSGARTSGPAPHLRWPRECVHVGVGVVLVAASELLDIRVRTVPPQGLDRSGIRWAWDRDQIGNLDSRAVAASDVASAASAVYPMLLAFASQPSGERTSGTLRRSVIFLEAYLFATAATRWIKGSLDRPRPYTYLATAERPGDSAYDVTDEEAFESLPSGHASTSFCGAALALTDHLLTRPHAGTAERLGISFAGGLLAGVTSTLRVRAGKHFPSDVLAGGVIGTTSGVLVPLAHHYVAAGGLRAPGPSRRAWLEAAGGLCVGAGVGVLIAGASY